MEDRFNPHRNPWHWCKLQYPDGTYLIDKHTWFNDFGWNICISAFQEDTERILKIGRYRYLRKPKNKAHYFITISLETSSLEDIRKAIQRTLKKCWIVNNTWYYCIEQRGDSQETMGRGLHIHLLILKNKRKSQVIRELAGTFKIKSNFIDVRFGETEELYLRRIFYLKGEKKESKLDKVKYDILFRQKNNLDPYYTNGKI